MHSYEYNRNYHPPMPIVAVEISTFENPETTITLEAIVDSGSDGTFLPEQTLKKLGAMSVRQGWVSGIQGVRYQAEIYMVKLAIGSYEFFGTRAIGDKQGRTILGRDILNQLDINLNGLANITEISQ